MVLILTLALVGACSSGSDDDSDAGSPAADTASAVQADNKPAATAVPATAVPTVGPLRMRSAVTTETITLQDENLCAEVGYPFYAFPDDCVNYINENHLLE